MFVDKGILDSLDLSGDHREHGDINSVELVKAAPGTTLTQPRKQLPHSLNIHREDRRVGRKEHYI